ncbi:MAG: bifunctional phosphopantothenoylcysteine decarboxylase/phosphopantothenate synthase [Solirubrobacteraceae bacterium]
MANILLGVSGAVAAYKALEFVRLATGAGHSVRAIQTRSSVRFVGRASFEGLTGAPSLSGAFELDPARGAFPGEQLPLRDPIAHLELAGKAHVYIVAPASANTLARLAHGHADDMLSCVALAASCPLLLAPAMNDRMYAHPATQANLQLLRARGAIVLEPSSGRLASAGEQGLGRMQEPQALLAACERELAEQPRAGRRSQPPAGDGASQLTAADPARTRDFEGLRVLVTAGGTREPIDSVRFVGNSSSGRMGIALAEAARARGAEVTVLAANVSLAPLEGVAWQQAPTAERMCAACERELPRCDVLLMAAAVADFRPAASFDGKLKKHEHERLALDLEPTVDVLSRVSQLRRSGQTLVGFAAEHGDRGIEEARRKLRVKGLDAVVLNDVSRSDIGFDSDSNEVVIVASGLELAVARASKRTIAEAILDAVVRLRSAATA